MKTKLLLLLSLFILLAVAMQAQTPTVISPVITVQKGIIAFPITVKNCTDIGSISLIYDLDPATFSFIKKNMGIPLNTTPEIVKENTYTCNTTMPLNVGVTLRNGRMNINVGAYTATKFTIPDGTWITIYLNCQGSTVLWLKECEFANENADIVSSIAINGKITVTNN